MYPYNIRRTNQKKSCQNNPAKPFNVFCTHNEDDHETPPAENMPENGGNDNGNNNNGNNNNDNCNNETPSPDVNRYVLEMLIEAIKDERADAKYYDTIANMLEDENDKKIIHKIHHDENKHEKIFTEIYELLTGSKPNEEDLTFEEKPVSENMAENFANSILDELSAVEFYRKILFSFLNQEIRDALFEIITDEQGHAQIANYMYSKYSQK